MSFQSVHYEPMFSTEVYDEEFLVYQRIDLQKLSVSLVLYMFITSYVYKKTVCLSPKLVYEA